MLWKQTEAVRNRSSATACNGGTTSVYKPVLLLQESKNYILRHSSPDMWKHYHISGSHETLAASQSSRNSQENWIHNGPQRATADGDKPDAGTSSGNGIHTTR